MCICKYHRRIGDAGQLSQCDAWVGDAWTDQDTIEHWSGWLWHGWFPVNGIWMLQTSPFDCQMCGKHVDDFVMVIGHTNLEDRHELSSIGVCFGCYTKVYDTYGFRDAPVAPNLELMADMKQAALEYATQLTDPNNWTFYPDHEYNDSIQEALKEMKQLQKLYLKSQGQRREMLIMAENALDRLDSMCSNAFWESEADYGNGKLFMRVSQITGSRFVASYSAEEDDPHEDVEYYTFNNQSDARRKCVEEVLRLMFKLMESSARPFVGKRIL
jgi:hypothetical protein